MINSILFMRWRAGPKRSREATAEGVGVSPSLEAWGLARAGFDKDHRQLITYRAVRQLLRDEGGTREFLSAIRPE